MRSHFLRSLNTTIQTGGLLLYVDAGKTASYSGSGSTWSDISGNSRNLTLFNSPTFASGVFTFNGSTHYATTTNCGLSTGDVAFTLEIWANFTTLTGTRWWLALLGQANTGGFHLIGTSATATQFGIWNSDGQLAPNLLGTGQWLHLVMTYDTSTLRSYVNRTTLSKAKPFTNNLNLTSANLNIGQTPVGEAYFSGKLTQIRVYNRALTSREVEQNFNATRAIHGV